MYRSDITDRFGMEDARASLIALCETQGDALFKEASGFLRTAIPVNESDELVAFGPFVCNLELRTFTITIDSHDGTGFHEWIGVFEQETNKTWKARITNTRRT